MSSGATKTKEPGATHNAPGFFVSAVASPLRRVKLGDGDAEPECGGPEGKPDQSAQPMCPSSSAGADRRAESPSARQSS